MNDLLSALKTGEEAYKTFLEKRIEPNPPLVKFHDPLEKRNLKTFSSMNKREERGKTGSQDLILKADHNLFAHMIIIAQTRDLEMKKVQSHLLGPLQLALVTAQGALRKTNKSALAKELQKNAAPAESFTEHSACIIDGMALVQKLKGNQKTFEELANNALAYIIIEDGKNKQTDVVFDVYRKYSIKNPERANRGAKKRNAVQKHCPRT